MKLIEQWLDDQSFINWVKQSDDIDIAKWEAYFNAHPEKWEYAKIGREMALGISFERIGDNQSKAQQSLSTFLDRLDESKKVKSTMVGYKQNKGKLISLSRRWSIAASLAFLVMVSAFSYLQFFKNTEVYIATTYGEQKEIVLPEGSIVTLNANSSLTYETNNPRKIKLVGEAFFEVKKIPKTQEPFTVTTQDLVVNVLGTSFNVNARNDQTKVFLEEGLVELEIEDGKEEIITMSPGDVIAYSKKELKVKENRKNVSVIENTTWKEGALMFDETRLTDALYQIEDIYGIHFVIESEQLRTEEISGGVPIKDLKVTLETLNQLYGIEIKSEGQRYFLSKE